MFPAFGWAADFCVTPSGSGSKNGTDWDNALDWSAVGISGLTRGDTYYLADGTYTAKRIATAQSGISVITLKKATVASHVTATGWADSMGDGQALFSADAYALYINAGYITIDGVVGSGADHTTYGFKSSPIDCTGTTNYTAGINVSTAAADIGSIILQHFAVMGCPDIAYPDNLHKCSTAIQFHPSTSTNAYKGTGMEVSECYTQDHVNSLTLYNIANSSFHDNYFTETWNSPAEDNYCHSQHFSGICTSNIDLYNNVIKHAGWAFMAMHGALTCHTDFTVGNYDWNIYNNVVIGDGVTENPIWVSGIIGNENPKDTDHNVFARFNIYNNTHHNIVAQSGYAAVATGPILNVANAAQVKNNLFYNCTGVGMANEKPCAADDIASGYCGTDRIVHDYNAYLSSTGNTAETNAQVDADATDPFTDSANGDYTLKSGTLPIDHGDTLDAAYDDDKAGVTRPQGAAWDMGAYEFEAPAGSWIVTFTTTSPCTAPAAVVVASGETGTGTLTVPNGYKHGTTSSGTWSGNTVTTAAITADTEVTLGCETKKIGGLVKP